jgi:hypothetical protein
MRPEANDPQLSVSVSRASNRGKSRQAARRENHEIPNTTTERVLHFKLRKLRAALPLARGTKHMIAREGKALL